MSKMSTLNLESTPKINKKRTRSTSESPEKKNAKRNGSLHYEKCETIQAISIKDDDDDDDEVEIKFKMTELTKLHCESIPSPSLSTQQPRKRRKISTEVVETPKTTTRRLSRTESVEMPQTTTRRSLRSSDPPIEYIETVNVTTNNDVENQNTNNSINNNDHAITNGITDIDIDSDSTLSSYSSSSTVSTITSDIDNNSIKERNQEQNLESSSINQVPPPQIPSTSSSSSSSSLNLETEQKHHDTLSITAEDQKLSTSSTTTLSTLGYCKSLLNVQDPPVIMPTKTNYLTAGLLSAKHKGPNATTSNSNPLLPLPCYCEELLLKSKKDFTLPYDTWCFGVLQTKLIHELLEQKKKDEMAALKKAQRRKKKVEAKSTLNTNKVPMPENKPESWNYKRLRTNEYYGQTKSKIHDEENEQPCSCLSTKNKCSTDDCLNRLLKMECPISCGEYCHNRRIQKYEYCKNLKKFMTLNKGYGIKALQPISKGEYLLEYVGEVVPDAVFKERMLTVYAQDTHHYCLHLDAGLVIDGHRKGGECRFVNHSCSPNSEMQKWSVNGLPRMALFALQDIQKDEELSYDYNFSLFNRAEGQPCHCGSENCRGVIGNRSKNDKGVLPKKKSELGNVVLVSPCTLDPGIFDKMKPLSETNKNYVQSHNVFLVRNFEKIRLRKGPKLECTVNEKLEKMMIAWVNRFKVGSSNNKPPIVNDNDSELKEMAKISSILYELFVTVTTIKDGNNLLAEPFMKLPPEKKYPQLYENFSKQQKQPLDLTLIGKKILRGQYLSIDHLEIEFLLVLREFSSVLTEEKPGFDELVKRVTEAYRDAKTKALPDLEPFIVGETIPKLIPENKDDKIQCICGIYVSMGCMVQCEKCLVWQHAECVGFKDTKHNFENNRKWKNNYSNSSSSQPSPVSTPSSSTTVSPIKENRKYSPRKITLFNGVNGTTTATIQGVQSIEEEKEPEQEMEKKEFYKSMKENECPKFITDSAFLSDMETQPLIAGYADASSEEEEVGVNELSLIPKAENTEKTEVVLQTDQSNSNETRYYCEKCAPRPFDEEIPLKDKNNGSKGETYYLTLKREDGFVVRQNCTYYILRDTPIENHETVNNNDNNLHHNNGEENESTTIILQNTTTTSSGTITTINGSINEQQQHQPLQSTSEFNDRKISVSYKTAGPLVPENCDIFHAETLWKNTDGSRGIYGHLYLRPSESFHEASRKFYPNEILYSPTAEIIDIDKIHGQCWVMDGSSFCMGRPKGFSGEEHVYICEHRTDNKNKILPKKTSKTKKKNNSSMEPYAVQKFETKLVIQRNYYPHGVPIGKNSLLTFGVGPKNSKKGTSNKKSSDVDMDPEKSKKQMTDQKTKQLNRLLIKLQSKIPNFNDDPADFSGLLVPGFRRKKSKVFQNA